MDTRHRNILLEHIPAEGLDYVASWIDRYTVSVTITKKRNSKMGDYRPPQKVRYHRISVNGDLHPYGFLVTLIHEIAHMVTWDSYRRKVTPHGEQWKQQFRSMLGEVLEYNAFRDLEIKNIVRDFAMGRVTYRTFNVKFEKKIHELMPGNGEVMLGDIPVNTMFSIHNGRTFIKKEKLRTRFRCQEVKTGRYYLISPLAKVRKNRDEG